MISPSLLHKLTDIVGSDHLLTQPEDLCCYAFDATSLKYLPEAVAFPANAGEVSRILALAHEHRFPVVPRGAGTGTTGGALPVAGGVVLVTSRLNRIVEIDADNFVAVVEPGVITGQLKAEVEKYGLYYPPDPSSANFCTIGGNVAECAGGAVAVRYGVTRDYVLGLSAVLPTGEIIDTGVRTAKGVVGYDLTRLLVGSEGTLAVITQIILRLVTKPAARQTILAGFADLQVAARTVGRILKARLAPTALEFLDQATLSCVRPDLPLQLPEEILAMLLIEVDGHPHDVQERSEKIGAFCREAGAALILLAEDDQEAAKLWYARKVINPAAFRLKPNKISEDVVVPITHIPSLVAGVQALARRDGLLILCFGHAGDGNIHVNIMFDRQNAREAQAAEKAVQEIFLLVRSFQGTLSGEHGIGITKSPYLHLELSEAVIALSRRIKQTFDPHHILNPGKIFV